ncbi:MAG: lipid kinase [Cyanobacteria bacterium QS_8_64_29]|nr:MAG: lipid kinase [Cyanobacteria bacterium QS_8_64_29]
MARALLLLNRHARQGNRYRHEVIERLQALGLELALEQFERPQQLASTIRAYRDRVDRVIVGGGDGTLNAAVEGILEAQLPLGILPLGTANDLARTLGIPATLAAACDIAANGRIQYIDLGRVNGKHFFNVASLGLSVRVAQRMSKQAKRRWGVLAYLATAARILARSRPFRAKIYAGGESLFVRTAQIAVGNGRHYGGGMTVVSDAQIDDGRLDCYSLEIRHWWQMLRLLPALRYGTLFERPEVRVLHGTEFKVYTRRPRSINTDGEITARTPAQFHLVPQALPVLVPAGASEGRSAG